MSRDELLELAALDAFGLLDEYETALYTRSFHHAPVGVQDELKELQADYAGDDMLLPAVEPEQGLRRRVLDSVANAIETESVELAPLAMIGRRRSDRRDTVARIGAGASGQVWRAASFALASAVLVMLFVSSQIYQDYSKLALMAGRQEALVTEKMEAGSDLYTKYVNNPKCTRIMLTSNVGDPAATGWLYLRKETKTDGTVAHSMYMRFEGLPPSGRFTLTASNAAGEHFTHEFATDETNRITGELIASISADLAGDATSLRWEVRNADLPVDASRLLGSQA